MWGCGSLNVQRAVDSAHPFAPRLSSFAQSGVIRVSSPMRSVVQAGVVLSFGGRPAERLRLLVAQCLFLLLCFGAVVAGQLLAASTVF